MKELLIIGMDPGTTLGYALLGIDGSPIALSSSKNYSINLLISEILKHGSPLIIGSDKKQAPALVASIATKLGAKLITQDHDLSVSEKKEICRGFEYKNDHERDALASALFAYKRQRKLFEKVDIYLKKLDLSEFSSTVKEI